MEQKENISKTDSGVSYSPLAEMELLEKSLNEIFIFDAVTLKFIHANKGACENLGYSLVEFQEMTPLDIKPEYTAETFAQLIEPLQNGDKKKIVFETVHLRKNGTLYNCEIHLQKMVYQEQEVYAAFIIDVTERKKAEKKLADKNSFLELILESSSDYIFVKDDQYCIVEANPTFLSLYPEAQRDKVIGYTGVEDFTEEESRNFLAMDRKAFEEGQSETFETINFPGGESRTLYTKKNRFEDGDGNAFILGVARDVTDRVREEEMLNNIYVIAVDSDLSFEERIEKTLEVGRHCFDMDLGIVSAIKGDEYKIQSVTQTNDLKEGDCFSLQDTYCVHTFGANEVKSWHNVAMSEIAHHPCYQKFGLNAYIGTTIYVNGVAYGTLNFTSIEARIDAFADREKSFVNLIAQYIGSEITKEQSRLEREVLIRNLQSANAELEEFAYRTSHDLRSPLISSVKLLEIAQEQTRGNALDDALRTMDMSRKALGRLDQLVTDILSLTYATQSEEDNQVIDVAEVIQEALLKLSHQENVERLAIVQDLQFSALLVTKKSRVQLIVENLISNAIKYQDMEKSDSFLKIRTFEEGGNFVLEVEDNGLGIPKAYQEKLFQMFKRFHSRISYGSGLGLYMIKKSAEILHGDVVYHDMGDGTRFTLIIPLSGE